MVWPNNYRTFGGWNPYRLTGRQFNFYKINRSGERFNKFVSEIVPETMAVPSGYYSPAWVVQPIKSGEISSYLSVTGEGDLSATILAIRLAIADLTGSGDLTAEGSLVVQLIADLIGTGDITDANVQAFLAAVAALSGSGAISSATVTGLGELLSALTGTGAVTSTSTGTGELSADIVSFGDLTIEGMREAVWSAAAANYNDTGTMGEKMNDAGSASNPWTEVIESGYTAAEILRLIASVSVGKSSGHPTSPVFRDIADTKDRVSGTVDSNGNRTSVTIDES